MKEVRTLYVDTGEDGVRLDRWFKRRWPHLNHIQIQKLARSGQIRVDGGRAKPDTRLAAGAQIRVPPLPDAPPPRDKDSLDPREVAFAKSLVLYEDDEVLVLNKPAGLAVQGGTKTSKHIDRLLSAWGEGLERPRLVHRLDRDTSRRPGAGQVAGRGGQARRRLRQAPGPEDLLGPGDRFPEARRRHPRPAAGQEGRGRPRDGAAGRSVRPQGRARQTEFVTLSRAGDRVAWMALYPHTGRTHQLRAHMLAMGHPILGDPNTPPRRRTAFRRA